MPKERKGKPTGWDPVADWYDGWMGKEGSDHHRNLALPAVLDLLELQPNEQVLDIGAGQGVLTPHVVKAKAQYTGVDISPKLLDMARERHKQNAQFFQGDARNLAQVRGLKAGFYDAAVFLLSIEDMNPLGPVLDSAAWALKPGGRAVILMRHPCFRVPRQSGWGFDDQRQLQYRRVDSYLSELSVPMKAYGKSRSGVTISFHRPMQEYINTLAANGLLVNHMREIATYKTGSNKAERRANDEIPLFLALRAQKLAVTSS